MKFYDSILYAFILFVFLVAGNALASTVTNVSTYEIKADKIIGLENISGNQTWEHQSYPAECSPGYYVTKIGDSNTCTDSGVIGGTWGDSQNASGYDLVGLGVKPFEIVFCINQDTGCDVVCYDERCADELETAGNSLISGGTVQMRCGNVYIERQINITDNSISFSGCSMPNLIETFNSAPVNAANIPHINGTIIRPTDDFTKGEYAFNIPYDNSSDDVGFSGGRSGIEISKIEFMGSNSTGEYIMNGIKSVGAFNLNIHDNVFFFNPDYSINLVPFGPWCDHNNVKDNFLMYSNGTGIRVWCFESSIYGNEVIIPRNGIDIKYAIATSNYVDSSIEYAYILREQSTANGNRIWSYSGYNNYYINGNYVTMTGNSGSNAGKTSDDYPTSANIYLASGNSVVITGNNIYNDQYYPSFFFYTGASTKNFTVSGNGFTGITNYSATLGTIWMNSKSGYVDIYTYTSPITQANYNCNYGSSFDGRTIQNGTHSCVCSSGEWLCYDIIPINPIINGENKSIEFTFDDGSGVFAFDSVNRIVATLYNMNTSIDNGTSGWSSYGRFGKSLRFDGIDNYVNVGNIATINITEQITLEAWIKYNLSGGSQKGILAKDHTGVGDGYGLYLQNTAAEHAGTSMRIGGVWEQLYTTKNLNDNQWHHIVATYNGTGITLYIDGTFDSSKAASGSISYNSRSLLIGVQAAAGLTYFDGYIDNVKIYNRAISLNEVRAGFNGIIYSTASGYLMPNTGGNFTNTVVFSNGGSQVNFTMIASDGTSGNCGMLPDKTIQCS